MFPAVARPARPATAQDVPPPDVLLVATVHGAVLAGLVLGVRAVAALVGSAGAVDLWQPWCLYALPVQTHAQSTVLLFAAGAPLFVRASMRAPEPVSVHAQTQLCYFVLLVVTTAVFIDTTVFFTIASIARA
jgi:hypothetical protein